jgi:hypothetical protein
MKRDDFLLEPDSKTFIAICVACVVAMVFILTSGGAPL